MLTGHGVPWQVCVLDLVLGSDCLAQNSCFSSHYEWCKGVPGRMDTHWVRSSRISAAFHNVEQSKQCTVYVQNIRSATKLQDLVVDAPLAQASVAMADLLVDTRQTGLAESWENINFAANFETTGKIRLIDPAELEKKLSLEREEKRKKEDAEPPPIFPWLPWEPLLLPARRLEFLGDSLMVTNWINGTWPVKSGKFVEAVGGCQKALMKMNLEHGCAPRCDHSHWVRHVRRCHNSLADELATRGKELDIVNFVQNTVKELPLHDKFFLRGFWDGGHNPGDDVVGIGCHLQFSLELPHEKSLWIPCAYVFGKCYGCSSADAEIQGFQTLLELCQRLLLPRGHSQFLQPFSPWMH